MPGPGGPGSAADRALGQRLDQQLLKSQVLVAGFPDAPPEVHIVKGERSRSALVFNEAGVDDRGSVDVGRERLVPLADIGSVSSSGDGVVTVQGHSGQMLVRMHFETVEDEQTWAQGLSAILSTTDDSNALAGAEGDSGDDIVMLQARSRQLQNQIGSLEALNERRDQQLNKMVKRLDGAMQMLAAVQDMCSQQRNVIQVQKVAIAELSKDLGLPVEATDEVGETLITSPSGAQQTSRVAQSEDSPGVEEEDEEAEDTEEQLADTDQMRALLEQADQMKNLLEMLEARGISADSEGDDDQPPNPGAAIDMLRDLNQLASLMSSLGPAGTGGLGQSEEHPEPEEEDCEEVEEIADGEDEEVVRARLRGLEAEKEKFEGLLLSSQQEHQDLLEKLNGMKALMSQLGLQEGDLDFDDDLSNLQ